MSFRIFRGHIEDVLNHATSPCVEVTGTGQGAETDTELSLDSAVRFEHVRPFFACAESQEFNSDSGAHKATRQCALGHILRHYILTLLPVVRFEHVRPFFACTESQEFISGVGVRNRTRHCALGHIQDTYF